MISDEKRREVAARMREIMRDDPHGWLDAMVVNAVTDVLGEGVAIGETVADLIDRPTCRNVSGYQDTFKCSGCGYKTGLIAELPTSTTKSSTSLDGTSTSGATIQTRPRGTVRP